MSAPAAVETTAPAIDGRSRWHRVAPVLAMLGAVLIGAAIPAIRNPNFYFWDDTAAVAVGVWQRIGQQVLAGELPFLQLDMWRGGNFIAEAATGMWNPVMLGLMVVTSPLDDMALAITIAKIALFLLAAGGVYLLARGYGASPWIAAVAGAVLPLSGWALFMDGTSWINGTAITAFTPWAWWALRRAYLHGFRSGAVAVAVVAGYVLASVGNPYGMVTLAAAFLAVAVEAILQRRRAEILWLVGLGVALVLMSIVIYLPFLLTSSVGFRAQSGIWNDEFLAPGISNLLALSVPTYKPYVRMFGLPYMTIPGMYLAWFVLPLLPWLRWRAPSLQWRSLAGLLTFGGFFLVFVLGPTQFSMFRWPARLIPFFYLAVIILIAVVLTQGLARSNPRVRILLSLVAIAAGGWQAFADMPDLWKWHGLVSVVIVALGWVFLRWSDGGARSFAILIGGTVLFIAPQALIAPVNGNVADYNLPRSKSVITERFADRYPGLTVQVADYMATPERLAPDRAWRDLLAGNMYSVAGVESTTAYSGVGFTKHDAALCITYNGATCRTAWRELWQTPEGEDEMLADLMGVQTVVVMRSTLPLPEAREGWTLTERTPDATIFQRDEPVSFEESRITVTGDDVSIESTSLAGPSGESATVSTGSGNERTVTFARLAWPGYSATVNGEPLEVVTGPAGLLQVELPSDLDGAELELRFMPPGLVPGLIALGLGVALAAALAVLRRRRATKGVHENERTSAA